MRLFKKTIPLLTAVAVASSLCACSSQNQNKEEVVSSSQTVSSQENDSPKETDSTEESLPVSLDGYDQDNDELSINSSAWNYDADNNVYWQIGMQYCSAPVAVDYETMAIYVPGDYFTGTENGDGTYTCTVNTENKINGYTADTAPVVMPVATGGYMAAPPADSYNFEGLGDYMEAGFVYVFAGCRGRDNGYDESGNLTYSGGAPWGVTDLKAAIRYYRFNSEVLPGDVNEIYTFGHSGGGAQSSLLGASGDSEMYYEYLQSIGAAMYDQDGNYISDAVTGAMCWCPVTSLDYADEAYEWNLGQYSATGVREEGTYTKVLSDDLAEAFAEYINQLGLVDEAGNALTLEQSDNGIYTAGSYYDYLLSVVNTSLNNFLGDTEFPYTDGPVSFTIGGDFPGGGLGMMPPMQIKDGEVPDGIGFGDMGGRDNFAMGGAPLGAVQGSGDGSMKGQKDPVTYNMPQDYIDSLNTDEQWVIYDANTNTAVITSMEAFVKHCKNATKGIGAFDSIEKQVAENTLFGNDTEDSLHFDSVLAALLQTNEEKYSQYEDWDPSLADAYSEDLEKVDSFGNDIAYRMNMYNPMYYISDYYEGNGTSTAAQYWRIRTGINQGDAALSVETNLALALERNDDVKDVDFATVWNQAHTTAERTGTNKENFIDWVNECAAQ